MEAFADVALLSRVQFALTVAYHFLFVPLSIGLGLILAINETRYYRSRKPEDAAATKFWVKIFTATFAIGVATGITMEFSFGTNWANYSRFVGDIFGAPLAAEALFAFFLESVFLGVLLFGRDRVSPKFYMVSSWLVWAGSCLSALWILIANSWMQTPAGGELNAEGTEAVITDFFAAAFNPSIFARYTHTVDALLIMGAFVAMAVAGWYLLKNRNTDFAMKTMRIAAVVGIVTSCAMIVFAHASAVVVWEEQPTKLAMMEGMYDSEVPPLYAVGIVDEQGQEVIAPFAIPGGTSFLATGNFDTEYPGLNELAQTEEYGDMVVEDMPVGLVFQSYHLMVAMYGLIMLTSILVLVFTFKGGRIAKMRWLQRAALISPVWPFIAIQTGWITAEVGRQPWVVYPSVTGPEGVSLLTDEGISMSVSAPELWLTLGLFVLVYAVLLIGWARVIGRFIKEGPVVEGDTALDRQLGDAADAGAGAGAQAVVAVAADGEGDVAVVVTEADDAPVEAAPAKGGE
ncbi:cytochrome ubiquinol oxidase subunit I [Adlercreutzia sp. R25]|uniref:cytochrome ubiquinol oxidase subunit I n=1 Tax=Adlercreutzia shanghongiae TaxID=3111773 RepID=UPI002DB590A7|nr:cytochrome ubiquinol oxidase subunit I [Adlercreutzia sp. R25]MEC4273847.1 cytochrome ubiquinol oxidase subunit I [Adlercreutzia sp. R25]